MTEECTELERTGVYPGDWIPGYELLSQLGSGGFGLVYIARQLALDRAVAIKVIRADMVDTPTLGTRFSAEAVALGKFHHPNIVQVYDYGQHSGRMFIAMELLTGEDLGRRIDREPLEERIAWAIARQTAGALAHAATLGVIHRDITPANIFLCPAPTGFSLPPDVPLVKVMDFGLALSSHALESTEGRLTGTGMIVGTPIYMAPEQYRRSTAVDHRADIYALGVTILHALTGKVPFEGKTIWDVVAKKLEHKLEFGPRISPASAQLIAAMMMPDPKDRIGTYQELIDRIDTLTPASGGKQLPTQIWTSLQPAKLGILRRVRKRWKLLVAAVVVLAGGFVAFESVRAGPPQPGKYISSGVDDYLFNGESIWSSAGGEWVIERDDEGVKVLAGEGFVQRKFPPFENYQLVLGLDLHDASMAEVNFAIPEHSTDNTRTLVLQVSREGGSVFGTREGDKGSFRSRGKAIPFPEPSWFKGREPYLEVKLRREGKWWQVWFNSDRVGQIRDDGVPKSPEIKLYAKGGNARVVSVILTELVERY